MTDRSSWPRLTHLVASAGCAAKLAPDVLQVATCDLPLPDVRLIVGIETGDDAGVVRLDAERGLVQTTDFFTPIVDDPYWFGAIAAANALSDVYAMGGEPLCALNLVAFPDQDLPMEMLREILRGGLDKLTESGAVLAGGHSIRDKEPKFGLAVSGLVHPDRVWRNSGVRAGDALVLTKPLGTGALTTARKRDWIGADELEMAIRWMARLNRDARDAAIVGTVHGATDVTGFGLAGHAWGMAKSAKVRIRFFRDHLPVLPGAEAAIARGSVPGGAKANRRYLGENLVLRGISEEQAGLVVDPQTSGGLLLSVPANEVDGLLSRLRAKDLVAAHVGEVLEGVPAIEVVAG